MTLSRAIVIGVIIAAPCAPVRGRAADDGSDIWQVFQRYLVSVRTADVAVAEQVWSQGADHLIAVTPFGRFEGWESIRTNVYVNFLQKAFTERDLQASNVATHVNGDAAWLFFDWTFTGKSPAGQVITSKGWESHVYRRTPRGWRLVALHYSVPGQPQ